MVKVGNIIYYYKWERYDSNHFVNKNNFRQLGGMTEDAEFSMTGFNNSWDLNELEYGVNVIINGKWEQRFYEIGHLEESEVIYDGMKMIKLDVYVKVGKYTIRK